MEYKAIKTFFCVALLGLMLAIPSVAWAYDVGESDALRSLGDGYNYRPPSKWKGSGGYNEGGGPIMMDQYLPTRTKKQRPRSQQGKRRRHRARRQCPGWRHPLASKTL